MESTDINNYRLIRKITDKTINLDYDQKYMGILYHTKEAFQEAGINKRGLRSDPPYALFSRRYLNEIDALNHEKKYDFCFIGSIQSNAEARQWVIEFAKKYFTENSVFVNTDKDLTNWVSLGPFDKTGNGLGFCPKEQKNNQSRRVQYRVVEENKYYFETMCQSKYILCPGGDAPWSFRFYETLLCRSIPIVESWIHTYRSKEEAKINYQYVLSHEIEKYLQDTELDKDYVNMNNVIFEHYHLYSPLHNKQDNTPSSTSTGNTGNTDIIHKMTYQITHPTLMNAGNNYLIGLQLIKPK